MTYEEIVDFTRSNLKKTGAKSIERHVAVEFDIYGEGEGAFYIEVKNGEIFVEPYEYYDRDAKIIITADELIKIVKGEKKADESVEDGILMFEGDSSAAKELEKLIKKTSVRKSAAASTKNKASVKVERAITEIAKKPEKTVQKDIKK